MQRLAIIFCIASFAGAQQRTPGRVGGSPNNPPTINRHATTTPAGPVGLKALAPDPGFADAQSAYPDLKPEGYQRLQFFSTQLKSRYGIDKSVHDLALALNRAHGDPVKTLVKAGITSKQARQISRDSLK